MIARVPSLFDLAARDDGHVFRWPGSKGLDFKQLKGLRHVGAVLRSAECRPRQTASGPPDRDPALTRP
jgi:hypothetical protein